MDLPYMESKAKISCKSLKSPRIYQVCSVLGHLLQLLPLPGIFFLQTLFLFIPLPHSSPGSYLIFLKRSILTTYLTLPFSFIPFPPKTSKSPYLVFFLFHYHLPSHYTSYHSLICLYSLMMPLVYRISPSLKLWAQWRLRCLSVLFINKASGIQ